MMKVSFNRKEIFTAVAQKSCSLQEISREANIAVDTLKKAMAGGGVTFQTYGKICKALNIEPRLDSVEKIG